MKKFIGRITAAIITAALTAGSLPFGTVASAQLSPAQTEKHGMLSSVSEDYFDYINSDKKNDNTAVPSMLDMSYLNASYAQLEELSDKKFPSSFDLRDYGRISPVENQSYYSTCWAFATLNSIESQLITQFTDISFSKKHLAWNAYESQYMREFFSCEKYDERYESPYDIGGTNWHSAAALSVWDGPVYSYRLPYDVEDGEDHLSGESDFHLTDVYFASGRTLVSVGHDNIIEKNIADNIIKELLTEYGSLTVAYSSNDAYYNSENNASYCYDENVIADHAVSLVGWDDDFSRENFGTDDSSRPENDGAWLIKNSWGETWGDDGYFWLSYEDASMDSVAKFLVDTKNNYSKYYSVGRMWSLNASADTFYKSENAKKFGYMSNIFTAHGDEQLEAVSFYTTDINTEYEITIYTDTDKSSPVSGTLAYSGQSGTEKYPGYHNVELDKAVAIENGENFSIVVKLTNPQYEYPLPIEVFFNNSYNSEPGYTDDGRVSLYSENGDEWNDVSQLTRISEGYTLCATGFCLNAFTNPLPQSKTASENVRFSIIEGPVTPGSKLELSGADEIWYSIDDGAAIHYTKPIVIEKACTVSAWSKTDGKSGNIVSRTYTKAKSALTEYTVKYGDKKQFVTPDMFEDDTEITLPADVSSVSIRPRGSDTIAVDGKTVASDEWSEEIMLSSGEKRNIVITSSADGKDTTEYTIHVSKRYIGYDADKETIQYDESRYTVKDKDGNILANGDSVSDYTEQEIGVFDKNGVLLATETTPKRYTVNSAVTALVYDKEQTLYTFSSNYIYSYKPDMSDAVTIEDTTIAVIPGRDVYIRRLADANGFASEIFCINVPERPAAPKNIKTEIGVDYIGLTDADGYEFRLSGEDEWASDDIIELENNTEYEIEVRKQATDSEFASEISVIKVKTLKGTTIPVHFVYNNTVVITDVGQLTAVGENIIEYDTDDLKEYGYMFDGENKQTVNVTEKDGKYIADREYVTFEIKPAVDVFDKTVEFVYYDVYTGEVIDKTESNLALTPVVNLDNLSVPEGYEYYMFEQLRSDMFITRLLYIDGAWYPFDSRVTIPVEKLPSVSVKIVDEVGNLIDEYDCFYGVGDHNEEAEIPDGYTAIGDIGYTVSVGRNDDDVLFCNMSEFVVTVKKNSVEPDKPVEPEEPSEPAKPAVPEEPSEPAKPAVPEEPSKLAKPSVPEKPSEPAKPTEPEGASKPVNPDTSGDIPFAAAVTPVIAVALMACAIITGKRKK